MRTLWLVIAFLLAVGGPFLAFSFLASLPTSVVLSLIALVLAAFAVRQSAKASVKDPRL